MKAYKAAYMASTALFSLWMIVNAYFYLASPEAARICGHFGFPGYLRVELAIAKITGVLVLCLPFIKGRAKEWAYAGFTITVVSGFIAHLCSGDGIGSASSALLALVILATSYLSYRKLAMAADSKKRSQNHS